MIFTKRPLLSLIIFLAYFQIGLGQILDDSTKQIYGPRTTSYVLEEDFLENRYIRINTDTSSSIMGANRRIDSLNYGIQNPGFIFNLQNRVNVYQDLGNFITPVGPIYYQPPFEIGRRLGYNTYDPYAIDPSAVKYYDTKSPYSSVMYVQGSKGQQGIDVEVSRNIRRNWNAGFDFRRMTSLQILGSAGYKSLYNSHYSFLAYTRYYSPNERYQVLFNFTHLHHSTFENGGIIQEPGTSPDSLFTYEYARVYLSGARALEKRNNYHLYQEFSLNEKKTAQIYHIGDYATQANRFTDEFFKKPADTLFYRRNDLPFIFSRLSTQDRTDYNRLENQLGVKGNVKNVSWRLFGRNKYFNYRQESYLGDTLSYFIDSLGRTSLGRDSLFRGDTISRYFPPVDTNFVENFIGGSLSYYFKDSTSFIYANGEYLIGRGDYRFKVGLNSKYVQAYYHKILYSPTLVQSLYRSNHFLWNNFGRFTQTSTDRFFLKTSFQWRNFSIQPGVTYDIIKNYTFFDTTATPQQTPKTLTFLYPEVSVKFNIYKFFFEGYARYALFNEEEYATIINIPSLFTHNRLYFQSLVFNSPAVFQIGVDMQWKASYEANKYMPITQQFYVNTDFRVKNYTLLDVFVTLRIKSFTFFVNVNNVNQPQNSGYFITPYYTGLPRNVVFGLKWMFFD